MNESSEELLEECYDQVKKIFVTKNTDLLKESLIFFASLSAQMDPKMDEEKWLKFLYQKYKFKMRKLSILDLNFKAFKECKLFILSPNIVALRPEDRSSMLQEKFLYFQRDEVGMWAWCQNSSIIAYEDQEQIDIQVMYDYSNSI